MSNTAFIFPGQGSQAIGMGRALAETFPVARQTFQEIDDALEQKLSALIFTGEQADLDLTENTQPALMAVSLAVIRVLQDQGKINLPLTCRFVAGHSLGEYSALAAVGTLGVADTARLLRARGQAMQRAVPVGQGAMAALLGADLPVAEKIAAAAAGHDICTVANDNAPGQVVISGHKTAIDRAIALAPEHGVRKAVLLPVSAPFHCPLMAPAAKVMAQALDAIVMHEPSVPVIANVSAGIETDPATIRRLLVEQVTAMVRWRESVLFMADQGVTRMVEIGAGKVLAGLVKRIHGDVHTQSISTPDDIDSFLASL